MGKQKKEETPLGKGNLVGVLTRSALARPDRVEVSKGRRGEEKEAIRKQGSSDGLGSRGWRGSEGRIDGERPVRTEDRGIK